MTDDSNPEGALPSSIDKSLGVAIQGQIYYPLSRPGSQMNPCAGKPDNTSCGRGCICRAGQCHYTLLRLEEMGIQLREK